VITFQCEHCQKKLNAPPRKAGQTVKCPNCERPVTIPAAEAEKVAAEQAPSLEDLQFEPRPVHKPQRRRSSNSLVFVGLTFTLLALAAVSGFLLWSMNQNKPQIVLATVRDAIVGESQPINFTMTAHPPAGWQGAIRFELSSPPAGAVIDPQTGEFRWQPTEEQGPGEYDVTIVATPDNTSAVAGSTTFHVTVNEQNQPPVWTPIEEQSAAAGETIEFEVSARDPDIPAAELTYRMLDGSPEGTTFDPATRKFSWTVKPEQEGQEFEVFFEAVEATGTEKATQIVHLETAAPATPSEELLETWRAAGAEVKFQKYGSDLPIDAAAQEVTLGDSTVTIFEFKEDEQRKAAAEKITKTTQSNQATDQSSGPRYFQRERLIVVYDGADEETLKLLSAQLEDSFAQGPLVAEAAPTVTEDQPDSTAAEKAKSDFEDRLFAMYEEGRILARKRYPQLREIYAAAFAAAHAEEITTAFGEEQSEARTWLNEHPDVQQELFIAINPEQDDVKAALQLFADLREQFPDQIEKYADLATAIAVTWDQTGPGVYDYKRHQTRVHAEMPDELIGPEENFRYFLDSEGMMQGRAQFLPWEFLTLLVNHRTPFAEREWAKANYLNKRVGFGACYSDVPYDHEMLRTDDVVCKMDGKEYTLANLKEFGGVCAQQADFAARVGKSLGVPAAYVRGESNSGSYHAWVMWVELKKVTPKAIDFELLSHGRYQLDEYYVGELFDPQTNQLITDRQLELHLHVTGMDPLARRQAEMVMRAYPLIRDRAELDTTKQLVFLREVAELCPGHPQIWRTLAAMSAGGEIEKQHSRQMRRNLDLFFQTFAYYPDFIWSVFEDLTAHQENVKERISSFARAVDAFEADKRPDLACEARLKMSDYLVKNNQSQAAIEGLAITINKFPGEGRYVPRMLDRLEEICKTVEGTDPQLIAFYQRFLPTIPTHRGSDPSDYCLATLRRGVNFFKSHGRDDLATQFQQRIKRIEDGTLKQ